MASNRYRKYGVHAITGASPLMPQDIASQRSVARAKSAEIGSLPRRIGSRIRGAGQSIRDYLTGLEQQVGDAGAEFSLGVLGIDEWPYGPPAQRPRQPLVPTDTGFVGPQLPPMPSVPEPSGRYGIEPASHAPPSEQQEEPMPPDMQEQIEEMKLKRKREAFVEDIKLKTAIISGQAKYEKALKELKEATMQDIAEQGGKEGPTKLPGKVGGLSPKQFLRHEGREAYLDMPAEQYLDLKERAKAELLRQFTPPPTEPYTFDVAAHRIPRRAGADVRRAVRGRYNAIQTGRRAMIQGGINQQRAALYDRYRRSQPPGPREIMEHQARLEGIKASSKVGPAEIGARAQVEAARINAESRQRTTAIAADLKRTPPQFQKDMSDLAGFLRQQEELGTLTDKLRLKTFYGVLEQNKGYVDKELMAILMRIVTQGATDEFTQALVRALAGQAAGQ